MLDIFPLQISPAGFKKKKPSSRMQETTSLWECSSTLERKTLPQTFICRACFFLFPLIFPYLLFISLQLEAFARSTQSLEKGWLGEQLGCGRSLPDPRQREKKLACADGCSLRGGSSAEAENFGAAGACNFQS